MPDEPRTSVLARYFSSAQAKVFGAGALGALLAASSIVAVTVLGASSTLATTGAPTVVSSVTPRAGMVADESQTVRDLWQYADAELRAQPTSTPTATPVPPTPVPPTATPRTKPAAAPPTATRVPPAPPPAITGLDTSPMDAFEQALFDATNARRIASGLPALRWNGSLMGIARIRSDEMAAYNYFAHESPITGETAFSLMDRYGVPFGWAGENLAKNNYPDDQAVAVADEALWNSPPHRENILNPNYTDVGIALTIDATGMKYFTFVYTGQ